MNNDRIIELYRGTLWECQLIESILKDAGIEYILKNKNRASYGPIISEAEMVVLLILESDKEEASKLIKQVIE